MRQNQKDENLRSLIREAILLEADLNLVPHGEVAAAIDNALSERRLGISIPGFRELMLEIAAVESGLLDGGRLFHNNEMSGDIKGVFQISPIALEQLRIKTTVPQTKARLDKSGAMQKGWANQTDSEIFGSVRMQALASCMYVLWLWYEKANKPALTSRESRANFWKNHYNTSADKQGTVAKYHKQSDMLQRA